MNIVLLSEGAKIPTRATEFSAGYDLYAPKNVTINPGRNLVPLDFKISLPPNSEAQIRPRSGFSLKGMEGRSPYQDISRTRFDADVLLGTIDEDYTGNVGVIIKSYEKEPFIIEKGTRIAQMVISHCIQAPMEVVSTLRETERGDNGFGHSGIK